jgi:uncharacterized membrane protein YozB (DUF420 family)
MVAILYWLLLLTYTSTVSIVVGYIGITWIKIENKHARKPWMLITALYLLNFLILYFGFGIPILLQIVFYGALSIILYFGTQLQIIGLTGGISTGKSTVS